MPATLKQWLNQKSISTFLLKYVICLRVLLGCYRTFNKSKRFSFCLRLYCLCVSTFVLTVYFYHISKVKIIFTYQFYYALFLDYGVTVIVRLFYAENNFSQYCRAIETNDRIAGVRKVPLISSEMCLMILVTTVIRALIIVSRYDYTKTIQGYYILAIMLLFSDLTQLINIMIFSILHSRMKVLRNCIETRAVLIHVTGTNSVAVNIQNIKKCLYYYNNLLDYLKYVDLQVQWAFLIHLIISFLKIVVKVLNLAFVIIHVASTISIELSFIFETFQTLILISSPAFVVEAIIYEVDRIKSSLSKQLVACKDESLRFELETALQYIILRPFKYTICGVIAVNMKLPFLMIGSCITYVILAMQLTHLEK